MEVKKEEEKKETVLVPNITGMTIKEAKKSLEEVGLILKLNVNSEDGIDKSITTITEQTPKQGLKAEKGGSVLCDINEKEEML